MNKKVVLITGASRGIGAEIAKKFAKKNYFVIVNYFKSKENAEELCKELNAIDMTSMPYFADVSSYEQTKKMIEYVTECFGHIDVLINNAGICEYNILLDEDEQSIYNQINTNLCGTIFTSKFVSRQMLKQGYGKIINISSIWGISGSAGESVYSATKGGIISFTKSIAKELAYSDITVNAIAPGIVETSMIDKFSMQEKNDLLQRIPLGRFANASEIANLALFLASDKSNYITGQVFQIDGGFTY